MSTSAPLDFSRFYELCDPYNNRPLRLSPDVYSKWITRDQAVALFRGKLKLDVPLKMGGYLGGQPADILWSGLIPLVCVADRVVELLQTANITGWSTYLVEVYDRKGKFWPGYHGFAITGGDCRRDRSRSRIETRQAVPGGQPFDEYVGLFFHEEDWDGSDIFWVRSAAGTVVTDKVYKLFKKARVTNVRFTPLPEVRIGVELDKYDKDI